MSRLREVPFQESARVKDAVGIQAPAEATSSTPLKPHTIFPIIFLRATIERTEVPYSRGKMTYSRYATDVKVSLLSISLTTCFVKLVVAISCT